MVQYIPSLEVLLGLLRTFFQPDDWSLTLCMTACCSEKSTVFSAADSRTGDQLLFSCVVLSPPDDGLYDLPRPLNTFVIFHCKYNRHVLQLTLNLNLKALDITC